MHSGSKRVGSRENVAVGKAPAQRRFPGGEARLFAAASGCVCVRIAARSSAPVEAPPPRHGAEVLRAGGNVGRARFSQKRYRAAQVAKSSSTAMAALLACGEGWFCAPRATRPCRRCRLPAEKVGFVPRERHAHVGDAACLRRRLVLGPASATPLSATLLACGEGWFCAPRASCPCRRRCLPAARALRKARPGSCAERFGVGASFCMQVTVDRTRGTARSGCVPSPPGFSPRRRGTAGPARTRSRAIGP